jgi:hypothetical protein
LAALGVRGIPNARDRRVLLLVRERVDTDTFSLIVVLPGGT